MVKKIALKNENAGKESADCRVHCAGK